MSCLGPKTHHDVILIAEAGRTLKQRIPVAGAWSEGLQHGHGRCQWAGGALYEGAWQKGARCGAGRLTTPSGQELLGAWEADAMHGLGFCRTDAGDRYCGGWVAGAREGPGVCMYACGERYEGAWAAGVRCGKGACVYANGDAYQGARPGHDTLASLICISVRLWVLGPHMTAQQPTYGLQHVRMRPTRSWLHVAQLAAFQRPLP